MNSPIVAAVVLAAGGGRRYGMPKALVEYEGSLLVERAVRTARAVCDPVLVVLGAQARRRLAAGRPRRGRRPGQQGLGDRDGLLAAHRPGRAARLAGPGRRGADHAGGHAGHDAGGPGEGAPRRGRPDALAVATYDGVRGAPRAARPRPLGRGDRDATGDEGARRYLAAHEVTEVDCTGLADPTDLDVPPSGVPSAP